MYLIKTIQTSKITKVVPIAHKLSVGLKLLNHLQILTYAMNYVVFFF